MPGIDVRSLSVCIQALQQAIIHNDFLSQSETVDSDSLEESSYMFELELSRIATIYKQEEDASRVNISLSELLKPPFNNINANS